jgi:LacI family transcriptional regulator
MDSESGARMAVSYLSQLGHRRIAFISGPSGGRSSSERLAGYRRAVLEHGLDASPELVIGGAGLLEDGWETLAVLLALKPPPTAVLCYNDLSAIGLLAAAAQMGVPVPDALSVVGYDNIPLSAYTTPPLTTVEQPKEAMGRTAVKVCLRALAGEPATTTVLSGQLVVRSSAAAPPRAQ